MLHPLLPGLVIILAACICGFTVGKADPQKKMIPPRALTLIFVVMLLAWLFCITTREEFEPLQFLLGCLVGLIGFVLGDDFGRRKGRQTSDTATKKKPDTRTTLERIAEIIEEYIEIPADTITVETQIRPLYALDGMGIGAIVFAITLQDTFGLKSEIPDEVAEAWEPGTVGDVIRYIDDRLANEA